MHAPTLPLPVRLVVAVGSLATRLSRIGLELLSFSLELGTIISIMSTVLAMQEAIELSILGLVVVVVGLGRTLLLVRQGFSLGISIHGFSGLDVLEVANDVGGTMIIGVNTKLLQVLRPRVGASIEENIHELIIG